MGNKAIYISEKKERKTRYPEIWVLVLSLSLTGHVTLASHQIIQDSGQQTFSVTSKICRPYGLCQNYSALPF